MLTTAARSLRREATSRAARSHGMADHPYPSGIHARLAFEPVHRMLDILGETGHGRKGVRGASPMAARIEKQQRVTGTMQWPGKGKHRPCIASPSVYYCQRGRRSRRWCRNEPGGNPFSVGGWDSRFRIGQPHRSRRGPPHHFRRTQAPANQCVESRDSHPEAGHQQQKSHGAGHFIENGHDQHSRI